MTEARAPVAIIGIGDALRHDDGVGPLLIDACRYVPIAGCDLVEFDGQLEHLIDAWAGRSLAIVIDALCVGADAGTLHDIEVDGLDTADAEYRAANAYAAEVADALRLSRQQGRLPGALHLFGIEPGDLKPGFGLSPPVAATMEELESRARSAAATAVTESLA